MDVRFIDSIADRAELRDLLFEYYGDVLPKFIALSGLDVDVDEMADDTLADPQALLPPANRFLLARDMNGRLVGCACIRRIREDAGEMKRMYVRPDARGTGLGRKLFEMRIEEARRMGLKWLYADTYNGNRAMLNMYEKYGFEYIPRYPGNANPPEFEPYLVYLSKRL